LSFQAQQPGKKNQNEQRTLGSHSDHVILFPGFSRFLNAACFALALTGVDRMANE